MGVLRRFIEAADRPGGRWALRLASNSFAKDLTLHHDGEFWLYSSNGVTLPRAPRFDFYDYDLKHLAARIRHYMHEAEDCWFHLYKPKPGDVIVDVGAEIGTDTVVFSRSVGPQGKVVAIEAQPDTYKLLLKTCEANRLFNVRPLWLAIADKPGEVRISADAGVESNFLADEGDAVPADTLDHVLRDIPKIDLLKMNIEGAEQLAIRAMDETIAKTGHVAIACHDFIGGEWFTTLDKVAGFLKSKGFTVTRREEDPREYARYHLHAVREQRR